MTYTEYMERLKETDAVCAQLEVCCRKCKHYGHSEYSSREPSGQCQLNPPGKYAVSVIAELKIPSAGKFTTVARDTIESSFPGVWTWDKCGAFEANVPDAAEPSKAPN